MQKKSVANKIIGVQIWLILMPVMTVFFLGMTWARDHSIEEDYFAELPVVLSASRLAQPLSEAPNAMTVIDRKMIEASGFRTVADLFRMVPGMYVAYATGWRQVVAYHGTTDDYARRMQVLVDGRSVFMPPLGAVAWENLPLQIDDIERIEVIRGPAAASHGGNSTQGVINIFTREAGDVRGFKASVSKGNGGIADASVSFGMPGEKFDYRISAGYRSDHGYDAIKVPTDNKPLHYDSHKTRLFNLRASFHPSSSDSLDIQTGYTSGSRGSGHQVTDTEPAHDRFTLENFAQLTWLHSMEGGDELKLQYYHIYQDLLNEIPDPASPAIPAYTDNATNTRDNWELQHTLHTSPENRLVWGASTRHDWTRADHQFLEEQNLNQYTLFAHDEWRFSPQWLLNVGAMQEDNGMGEKKVSPRMALIQKLTDNQSLRIGISKAHRNPSVYEERGNFHAPETILTLGQTYTILVASGDLKPESVLSREIGYVGEFSEYGLSVDARLYHDQLRDIMFTFESTNLNVAGDPIYDIGNLFDAEHKGFELTTKHHWGDSNLLTFNYAWQLLSSPFIPSATGSRYSETMPRNMISALYSTAVDNGLAFSLGYYQQDAMLPLDRPDYDRQQLTRRVDVKLAKNFKLGREAEGELAWVVQGLFDGKHIEYEDANVFNRRTYLTATINY